MIERRRIPSAAPGPIHPPPSSGPRWTIDDVIFESVPSSRGRRPGSTAAIPQIPHIPSDKRLGEAGASTLPGQKFARMRAVFSTWILLRASSSCRRSRTRRRTSKRSSVPSPRRTSRRRAGSSSTTGLQTAHRRSRAGWRPISRSWTSSTRAWEGAGATRLPRARRQRRSTAAWLLWTSESSRM